MLCVNKKETRRIDKNIPHHKNCFDKVATREKLSFLKIIKKTKANNPIKYQRKKDSPSNKKRLKIRKK